MAAQYRYIKEPENAQIAIKLAEYYKQKIPAVSATIVRGYLGALYYYASTNSDMEFNRIKQDILQHLEGKAPYYAGNILFAEAILNYRAGYGDESLGMFEQAFFQLEKQQNFVLLSVVERYLQRFGLIGKFRYKKELQQLIDRHKSEPNNVRKLRNIHADFFSKRKLPCFRLNSRMS